MEQPAVQQLFFQHIKNNLPPHLSFVDEMAEILGISNDSAYRRIRGEKPISFEEIQKLASHFKISLDQFLHLQTDSILFSGKLGQRFGEYLNNLLQNFMYLTSFEQKHLYFLTKDIPWINYFQIPELASFKIFLWMKSILHYDELRGEKFSFKKPYPEYLEIGKKIIQQYNRIPTTEIWNIEGTNITLQQIEYYRESELFESKEDAAIIYDKLEELINHIEKQAEMGKKFAIGEKPGAGSPDFTMFNNELVLGDNTVVVDLGKMKIAFLNHSVIEFINTRDERFANYMYETMLNLIRKSTQISTFGEKNRSHFFSRLRGQIRQQKEAAGF